jgi:hypothetical protein
LCAGKVNGCNAIGPAGIFLQVGNPATVASEHPAEDPTYRGDEVRLSAWPLFVCKVCGHRGADIRPLFEPARMGT